MRTAVAVAALAVPLFATGTAQAALAGASPSVTTTSPDLRSATIVDPQDVILCFDKPITANSAAFSPNNNHMAYLTGYASSQTSGDNPGLLYPSGIVPTSGASANPNCVDLNFASGASSNQIDLNQWTAVTVDAGAFQAAAGSYGSGGTSLNDSVTLTNTNPTVGTHNGTSGLTTGPDLLGTAPAPAGTTAPGTNPNTGAGTPPPGAEGMVFAFDQAIDFSTVNSYGFWIEDSSGNFCHSYFAASVSGNPTQVIAFFAQGVTSPNTVPCSDNVVANARQAGVDGSSVWTYVDGNTAHETPNQLNSVAVAAPGGSITQIASLSSAALQGSGFQVAYTFDHPVITQSTSSSDYYVALSDGQTLQADQVFVGGSSGTQGTVVADFQHAKVVKWVSGFNGQGGTYEPVDNAGFTVSSCLYGTGPTNCQTEDLQDVQEYAVQGIVGNGAAQYQPGSGNATTGFNCSAAPSYGGTCTNTPGSTPIGGNTGGFARGYSTGPDLYAADIVPSGGFDVLRMYVDQRVVDQDNNVDLLNAAGQSLYAVSFFNGANTATFPTTPTNPELITATLNPASIPQGPTQVQLSYCAFDTALNAGNDGTGTEQGDNPGISPNDTMQGENGCALPQIVELSGTASHLKSLKHLKVYRAKKAHKKAHKAHKAHRAHRKSKRA